jgi:hypothetical protein
MLLDQKNGGEEAETPPSSGDCVVEALRRVEAVEVKMS